MSTLSKEVADNALDLTESKEPLEEILNHARQYREQTKGDKVYVSKKDMEALLESNKLTIICDGQQRGGGYLIEGTIETFHFIHISRQNWWSCKGYGKEQDFKSFVRKDGFRTAK